MHRSIVSRQVVWQTSLPMIRHFLRCPDNTAKINRRVSGAKRPKIWRHDRSLRLTVIIAEQLVAIREQGKDHCDQESDTYLNERDMILIERSAKTPWR